MTLYLGYMTSSPTYLAEWQAKVRAGGPPQDEWAMSRVVELRRSAPDGCRIIGSYVPVGGGTALKHDQPGVPIVETDDTVHLQFISTHYTGLLDSSWVPGIFAPGSPEEMEAQIAAGRI